MSGLSETVEVRGAEPGDAAGVEALLTASSLPVADVRAHLGGYLVVEAAGELVAVAGLEVHEPDGLLRSVAVRPDWRDRGLGGELVDRLLLEARARGLRKVYLLTETAEAYFARRGFRLVERSSVDSPVQSSVEFGDACPAGAAVMELSLE